jgi:hypothetical protein
MGPPQDDQSIGARSSIKHFTANKGFRNFSRDRGDVNFFLVLALENTHERLQSSGVCSLKADKGGQGAQVAQTRRSMLAGAPNTAVSACVCAEFPRGWRQE